MGYYTLAFTKDEEAAYDYAAMQHSDVQGPCCCERWRWKVYGGLSKVVDSWNVGQGCGGANDTKMH